MVQKTKLLFLEILAFKWSLLAAIPSFIILIGFNTIGSLGINDFNRALLLALSGILFFYFYITETILKSTKKGIALFITSILLTIIFVILNWLNNELITAQVLFFLSSVILIGNPREKDDHKIWQWQNHLIKSGLEAFLIGILFIASTSATIFLIQFLFDTGPLKWLSEFVGKFSVLVMAIMFIIRMPIERDMENHFFIELFRFIIIPLWFIYTFLLNIYALKILFLWTLPKGIVSIPIIFSFFAMIISWWLLKQRSKIVHWPSPKLLRSAVLLHIPLLILLATAIGRRIYDYGWTDKRSSVVMLLGFFLEILFLLITQKLTMRKLAITYWLCQLFALIPF